MKYWALLLFSFFSNGLRAAEPVSVLDQPPFIYAICPYNMIEKMLDMPIFRFLPLGAQLQPHLDRYGLYVLGREISEKPFGLTSRVVLPGTMTLEGFNDLLESSPITDHPVKRQLLEQILPHLESVLELEALKIVHDLDSGVDIEKLKDDIFECIRNVLGPVRTYYMRSNASLLSRDQLTQLTGLKGEQPLPVLRRFGFVRNRRAQPTWASRPDNIQITVQSGSTDTLLVDSAHAHFAGFAPISAFEEFETVTGFGDEMNSKELRHMWRLLSNKMHQLSFKLLARDIQRRKRKNMPPRAAVTPNLLELLEEESHKLDLSRAFFFVIEDYSSEEMAATMALIDGTHREGEEAYDLPIVRRLKDISKGAYDLSAQFQGPLFEMHSLAIDPEAKPKVSLEELFLVVAQHIEDAGFEDATFLGQTDLLGGRLYAKYGFKVHEEASKIIGKDEVVLSVKGRDFIDAVRKLMPLQGIVRASLPNRITKRLAAADNDHWCEAQANGQLNVDDAAFAEKLRVFLGGR